MISSNKTHHKAQRMSLSVVTEQSDSVPPVFHFCEDSSAIPVTGAGQ